MTVADDLCGMNKMELWAFGADLRVVGPVTTKLCRMATCGRS